MVRLVHLAAVVRRGIGGLKPTLRTENALTDISFLVLFFKKELLAFWVFNDLICGSTHGRNAVHSQRTLV